jgi:hypothetical protein
MRKWILVAAGLFVSTPASDFVFAPTAAYAFQGCGAGYYRNTRGHCIPRPARANRPPAGATARCRDGTYSFSASRRGTCSHHGGVADWLY